MRISDWSSDVCSSDLAGDEGVDAGALAGADHRRRDADNVEPGGACLGPDAVDDGFHGENSRSICFWSRRNTVPLITPPIRSCNSRIPRMCPAILSRSSRSEEHTSELQSLMRISYAVFCLKQQINEIHERATHSNQIQTLRHTP